MGPAEFLGVPCDRVTGMTGSQPEDECGSDLGVLASVIAEGRLDPDPDPVLGDVREGDGLPHVPDALRQRTIRGKAVLTIPEA